MTKSFPLLRPIFVAMTVLLPIGALAASPSPAATTQSFQISPPTANYAGNAGSTTQGTIKVTNLSGVGLTLDISKQNFVAKGEEGEIELVDNADPLYSLAPWFSLSASTFDLPARATKSFTYTILLPANAEPGGRYGSIIFRTTAAKLPNGQSGAAVVQQIAGVVFQRINGQANEKLKIASFATDKSFYEYGPINFTTRVQNTGSVHEKPTGTITIKNMLGLTVATLPLDEHFVIPGAIRRLHNEWPSSGKRNLLLGRYTAHVDATYANGQKLSADTAFTVIPYKLIIGILIVLFVLFIVFWRGRRRFGRAIRILAGRE